MANTTTAKTVQRSTDKGRFYDIPEMTITPRPVQKKVPFYMACFSRASMERTIVIHGAGPQLDAELAAAGIEIVPFREDDAILAAALLPAMSLTLYAMLGVAGGRGATLHSGQPIITSCCVSFIFSRRFAISAWTRRASSTVRQNGIITITLVSPIVSRTRRIAAHSSAKPSA